MLLQSIFKALMIKKKTYIAINKHVTNDRDQSLDQKESKLSSTIIGKGSVYRVIDGKVIRKFIQ